MKYRIYSPKLGMCWDCDNYDTMRLVFAQQKEYTQDHQLQVWEITHVKEVGFDTGYSCTSYDCRPMEP